jgi:hypothetical protein
MSTSVKLLQIFHKTTEVFRNQDFPEPNFPLTELLLRHRCITKDQKRELVLSYLSAHRKSKNTNTKCYLTPNLFFSFVYFHTKNILCI